MAPARAIQQFAQELKYNLVFWSVVDGLVDAIGQCVGR
jgi:hypothetical protein